jgi:hypothetical protein
MLPIATELGSSDSCFAKPHLPIWATPTYVENQMLVGNMQRYPVDLFGELSAFSFYILNEVCYKYLCFP